MLYLKQSTSPRHAPSHNNQGRQGPLSPTNHQSYRQGPISPSGGTQYFKLITSLQQIFITQINL